MADEPITSYPQISYADMEDIFLIDPERQNTSHWRSTNEEVYDQYRRPGTFLDTQKIDTFLSYINNLSYLYSGFGGSSNILQNFFSRLDRHGTTLTPLNSMNSGYTFITRPRLNLTSGNLRQHPIMATLNSENPNSVIFMIRALLDTRLCNGKPLFRGVATDYNKVNLEAENFTNLAIKSGLVDLRNPFLVPLCNGLKGISGFPDFTIMEETTEGDFHSGDFTFIKGGDMNNKTQELSLEFRDVQGSIILSIIYYWCLMMALQAKGVCIPYPDDIYEQRLNYTVSIYRFVMDTARTQILWWAKATGCFPKSAPVGALFNINQGEVMISSAMNFSIPFVANDIKVNDPGALLDFNMLMRGYCPSINHAVSENGERKTPWRILSPEELVSPASNFNALPYIVSNEWGLELQWRTTDYYNDAILNAEDIQNQYEQLSHELNEAREDMIYQLQYQQEQMRKAAEDAATGTNPDTGEYDTTPGITYV